MNPNQNPINMIDLVKTKEQINMNDLTYQQPRKRQVNMTTNMINMTMITLHQQLQTNQINMILNMIPMTKMIKKIPVNNYLKN